jgi:thiamine phosphate synthase YjbQ (UPF0047 family)
LPTHSGYIPLTTQGDGDVCPLSDRIVEIAHDAGVERGVVTVFVPGATAAITAMEFEPGGVHDLKAALDRLIPREGDYEPGGSAPYAGPSGPPTPELRVPIARPQLLGALFGPSVSVPLEAGRLMLGTLQEIVLIDFDDRPRERTVLVSVQS